ncbi:MAG: aminotransferase class IV [Actinobacteria bacterium]|nr:aminotransferase class IV [Actinomycetota bacterium]
MTGSGAHDDSGDRTPVVWLDGSIVDAAAASLHWSDHGITVGDGVFETIELRRGAPFALRRHLDRLERSCSGLRIDPPPRHEVAGAVDAVRAAWGTAPGRLRITVTSGPGPMGSERGPGGPTVLVSATSMVVRTGPTDVVTVPFTRNEHGALAGLKTTSYAENVLALRIAAEAGASEAIFANTAGMLCEGTGSNVFAGIDGRLVTPTLSSGCLAGVTRALLLEALERSGEPAVEAAIPIGEWQQVEEAFLVSTGRHVQPIRRIDGVELAACPGPLTRTAARIWSDTYSHASDP